MDYSIELIETDEGANFQIGKHIINDTIFDDEMIGYHIVDIEDCIRNLIAWIAESKNQRDIDLMISDLRLLLNVDSSENEFIFTSIHTNKYIIKSENPARFNEMCSEIIELNNSL